MAFGAGVDIPLPLSIILAVMVIISLSLSRRYFVNLVQRCEVKPSWTVLLGTVFLCCTLIVGSADVGAIAFVTIVLNSILVVYPLFARESELLSKIEGEPSLYLSQVLLIIVIFTIGLLIMPTTTILPSLGGTGGLLALYTAIGFTMVLLGAISTQLISPRSANTGNQGSDAGSPGESDNRTIAQSRRSEEATRDSTEAESSDSQ